MTTPTTPEATPIPKRRHLIESAGYWFKASRKSQKEMRFSEAILAMENAYNHVENALAASEAKLAEVTREHERCEAAITRAEAAERQAGINNALAIAAEKQRDTAMQQIAERDAKLTKLIELAAIGQMALVVRECRCDPERRGTICHRFLFLSKFKELSSNILTP